MISVSKSLGNKVSCGKWALLVALGSTLLATAASGDSVAPGLLTFTIAPDGAGNVVVNGSGTVNLSGDDNEGTDNDYNPDMSPSQDVLNVGPTESSFSDDVFFSASGPANFGTGGFSLAASGTGSFVSFSFSSGIAFVGVPTSYVSDATLTDSALFSDTTLAGLELTPGSYSWSWAAGSTTDTVDININEAPEPATWGMVALGSVALLAWRLPRREVRG